MFRQPIRSHSLVCLAIVPLFFALFASTVWADTPPARRTTPLPDGQRTEITMTVPLDAIIFIDGQRTYNSGIVRRFRTPPLASGKKYFYDVKVTWVDGSRARESSRHLSFRAGDRITLQYSQPNGRQRMQDLWLDPAAPVPTGNAYYQDPLSAPYFPNYISPGSRLYPR